MGAPKNRRGIQISAGFNLVHKKKIKKIKKKKKERKKERK